VGSMPRLRRLALTARHTRFHESVILHENVQYLVSQFPGLIELELAGLTTEGVMPTWWPGQWAVPVSTLRFTSTSQTPGTLLTLTTIYLGRTGRRPVYRTHHLRVQRQRNSLPFAFSLARPAREVYLSRAH
jgi:hypothetical protein